jgi:hypothetical protein
LTADALYDAFERAMTAFWYPYRGARISLVRHEDGTFCPRLVRVTLHRAGQLVEREIRVPQEVQDRRYPSREAAAAAALEALDLGLPIAI